MLGSLVITLREGLEAALVIGIIFAYLSKSGNRQGFRQVWWGTGLAVLASLSVGAGLYFAVGEFSGKGEQLFEGLTLLAAVALLTWMIFWMRKQSANIKSSVQDQVKNALIQGSGWGIMLLAFVAVVREGVETVVFLLAAGIGETSGTLFLAGGIIGLLAAFLIGYLVYRGSARLNLKTFFNLTGLFMIVFAAGMLSRGVHELIEAGYVPALIEHVWNVNNFINIDSTAGHFLNSLFGYSSDPSLIEVIVYAGYILIVHWLFLRQSGNRRGSQTRSLVAPQLQA
jgi:high-affinity iron transporter